jgi:hypothetical protein
VALWLAIATESRVAKANPTSTWLEIVRTRGSEACPDVDSVFGALSRLFPEQPIRRSMDDTSAAASASVRIRPTSLGHEALVRVTRPREGERIILDDDVECSGLANALAVALVMLIEPASATTADPAQTVASRETMAETASGNAASTPPPMSTALPQNKSPARQATFPTSGGVVLGQREAAPPNAQRAVQASASAMAVGGFGLLGTPSAGIGAGITLSSRSGFAIAFEGLRLWSSPAVRAPGEINLALWGLLGGPCYRSKVASNVMLQGCLLLGAGSQTATSRGYWSDDSRSRPWVVAGPSLDLSVHLYRWLGTFVNLAGVGHLKRQSFSVDCVAEVVSAPVAGVMLGLGLRVETGVF